MSQSTFAWIFLRALIYFHSVQGILMVKTVSALGEFRMYQVRRSNGHITVISAMTDTAQGCRDQDKAYAQPEDREGHQERVLFRK